MIWTEELKQQLLACASEDELRDTFPGQNVQTLKRRIQEFGGSAAFRDSGKSRLGRLADLLERSGIDIEEIANVDRVTVKEWQAMHKDEEGEAVVTDMSAASIVLTPSWESGPKWQTIQQADPIHIHPRKFEKDCGHRLKTAIIMPDLQVGFRRDIHTEKLDPFHDERCMELVLTIMDDFEGDIDLVVNIGDGLDNAEFGRFIQEPAFARTTQRSLNALHCFLGETVGLAPQADFQYLEGNHDRRLEKLLLTNAQAAYGIQRANVPKEWPVLSVPYLLRLDELGYEYLPGYPANITWINERLSCVHGDKVRSSGSTAAAVIDDQRVSVIFGHIHRIEKLHRTRNTYHGGKSNFAASIGCLCRIDGAVPSMKGSTDPYGRPMQKHENWQNGFAVVTYEEGDGAFDLEQVCIHDGQALFRGNLYKAS